MRLYSSQKGLHFKIYLFHYSYGSSNLPNLSKSIQHLNFSRVKSLIFFNERRSAVNSSRIKDKVILVIDKFSAFLCIHNTS